MRSEKAEEAQPYFIYQFGVGLERDDRRARQRHFEFVERGLGHLHVIGLHHQVFEVDRILHIVGQKRFKGSRVSPFDVFAPEQDGKPPVHAVERASVQAQAPLAAFQSAAVTQAAQQVPQVDMDVVYGYPEVVPYERQIETGAVVSDENFVFLQIVGKAVEVIAVDIVKQLPAVIERYGGDVVVRPAEARRFYIEVGYTFAEVREKSPQVAGAEGGCEKCRVRGAQFFTAYFKMGAQRLVFRPAERGVRPTVLLPEKVPGMNPSLPQRDFRLKADPRQMNEGMQKHCKSLER